MAQQTINVGAAPNDGTGTPLRTAFQYTNSNFSELYTAVGPSGNNIVVPGNATITGDLTVDTNVLKVDSANNRVGIGTATPIAGSRLDVRSAIGTGTDIQSLAVIDTSPLAINNGGGISFGYVFEAPSTVIGRAGYIKTIKENATDGNYASAMVFGVTANGASTAERYRIGSDGTSTWYVGGSTAMTLNSTGLGVGVTPSYRLDVSSSSNIVGRISSSSVFNTGFNIVNTTGATWSLYSFGSNDATLQNSFGIYHQSGTSFLQITQAGNVGIGVTPSAWGSGFKALEVGRVGSGFFSVGATSLQVTNNFYYNGTNYIYSANGAATRYHLVDGSHQWHNAASGTAGNTITFTQAMTLDASGNLLVGTPSLIAGSASGSLNIVGANTQQIQIRNSSATAGQYWRQAVDSSNTIYILNNASTGVSITSGATSWSAVSDERLKDIIEPIGNAVAKVGSLRSVIGKYKSDSEGTRRSFLIAQDVQSVLPEAVDTTNADAFGVRYSEVIPLLVAAIKELAAEVNALKNA